MHWANQVWPPPSAIATESLGMTRQGIETKTVRIGNLHSILNVSAEGKMNANTVCRF